MTSSLLHPSAPRRALPRGGSLLLSVLVAGVLSACASGVSLDEVPVSDRSGTAVSALGQGSADTTQGGAGSVSAVQVGSIRDAQPEQLARVVYFDFDSFVVKPEFTALLEANARYLKADPKRRVALEGHTDERGGREYNLALGQKRAEAVRRAMGLLGVNEQQMEPVSFGEEKPAISGFDESAYAKNRRVEFTYR
ncbi:MAG: peptidoglycan-associated lipoprotein Pal [Hydrogenophaga sp.]